jgi:hypothetical protein
MLFGRGLLDNETWLIMVGMLGMKIAVHHKDRGLTRKATRYERLYLLEVLEHMKGSGVSIEPGSPDFEAIVETFAEAIFLRGRPTWEALFLATTPKGCADSFLADR